MATQITLKVKDEEGNVKKVNHEIEDIDGEQFAALMETVTKVMKEVNEDESLKGLFNAMYNNQLSEDAGEQELLQADAAIIQKAIGSFETILVRMPNHAFNLLSVLSGIEVNVIKKQKMRDLLDIYDAILNENDIEDTIKRLKKSLALTQVKFKFQGLVKKATSKVKAAQ